MTEGPVIQAFSGDSWDECSTLIHNVRTVAYREGKIRDQAWMADLASIHFMGEALVWYARLPQDVQEDWSKLQAALAHRWSTPECEFRCASCARSPEKPGYLTRGFLKAVVNGSDTTFYLKEERNVQYFTLTQNVEEAVCFRFESQSSSALLAFFNAGWYQWLAIHWGSSNPNLGQGSTDFGYISAVDPETMKSSYNSSNPFQLVEFRFLSSGEVVPVQRDGKTERDLAVFMNGSNLHLSPDPEAYGRKYPSEKRMVLYIQTIFK